MNLAEIALRLGRDPARAGHPAFSTAAGAVSNADVSGDGRGACRPISRSSGVKARRQDRLPDDQLARSSRRRFSPASGSAPIPVLQNSQLGQSELEHIVDLSDPALFLLADRHARRCRRPQGCRPDVPRMIVTAHGPRGMLTGLANNRGFGHAALPAPFDAKPRHARLHRLHLGHHRQTQGRGPRASLARSARRFSNRARVPPQPGDVILATGEWSFISALGHNVLFPLRNGTTGSIMEDRAAPERILQTIERDRVTLLHSVATLYRRILATPGIENRYDLRRCAAPTPPASRWRMPCARNGRPASAARSGSTTASRKRRW